MPGRVTHFQETRFRSSRNPAPPPLPPNPMPPISRCAPQPDLRRAFTLVEMLVSLALLAIIVGVVIQMTDQTSSLWRNSALRIQAFQEARAGFESMSRNLSQATLNSYYDYYDASNTPRKSLDTAAQASFTPVTYDLISDLHFVSGQAATLLPNADTNIVTQTHAVFFQAPLGYSGLYSQLDNALNACGYFLQFDDASTMVPDHVRNTPGYLPRYRFRLMEMTQGTEKLKVYDPGADFNSWFIQSAAASSRVIAENVIALVLLPRLPTRDDLPGASGQGVSLAPNYNYNSRVPLGATADPSWPSLFPPDSYIAYPESGGSVTRKRHDRLPPLMRVVMVVIDEASAIRLQGESTTPPAAIDLAKTNLFTDATRLEADLQALEDICNAKKGNLTGNTMRLTYRIFSTDLIMRDAR